MANDGLIGSVVGVVGLLTALVVPVLAWRSQNRASNVAFDKTQRDDLYTSLRDARKDFEETHAKLLDCQEKMIEVRGELATVKQALVTLQARLDDVQAKLTLSLAQKCL